MEEHNNHVEDNTLDDHEVEGVALQDHFHDKETMMILN
jgi:hypothetical protein